MKKRIIAAILALSIIFTFVGCNVDELSFYQTLKSIANLQDITFEGSIAVNVKNLEIVPEEEPPYESRSSLSMNSTNNKARLSEKLLRNVLDSGDLSQQLVELKDTLDNNSIFYDGVISVLNNKISLNIGVKNSEDVVDNFISIMAIDKTIYLTKDIGLEIDENATIETVNGIEYATFTFAEIAEEIAQSAKDSIGPNPFSDSIWDDTHSMDYWMSYDEGFFYGSFAGFDGLQKDYTITSPYVSDTDAYILGYDAGYASGENDKVNAFQAYDDIDEMKDLFLEKASVSNILKAMQGISTKGAEEFIKNFFSSFEFGLVQKSDSKYSLTFDNDKLFDAIKGFFVYCSNNQVNYVPTLKTIINSLTDDELLMILIRPEDKQVILDGLDYLAPLTGADQEQEALNIAYFYDTMKVQLSDQIQFGGDYSLEKTGDSAYEENFTLSVNATPDTWFMINDDYYAPEYGTIVAEFDIVSSLSINKSNSGNNNIMATVIDFDDTSANINITSSDEDAVEVGIVYSATEDFQNPIILAGIENEDDTFTANITGLTEETTYYFKSYSKDEANIIVYGTPKSFLTDATPDTTGPTITGVTGNPTAWQNTDVTLTVAATDEGGIATTGGYSFDDGATWQTGNTKVFSANASISIKVKDLAGNISTATVVQINKIDKTAPTITVTGNPTTKVRSALLTIGSTADLSGKTISVSKDGGAPITITGTTYTATANGTYVFTVTNGAGVKQTSTVVVNNISASTANPTTSDNVDKGIIVLMFLLSGAVLTIFSKKKSSLRIK